MSARDLPEYSVIECTWHSHPILSNEDHTPLEFSHTYDEDDMPMDLLVKLGDEEWVPVGCETWWTNSDKIDERSTFKILAVGMTKTRGYYDD